jgi:hypothetical protein
MNMEYANQTGQSSKNFMSMRERKEKHEEGKGKRAPQQ